MMKRHDFRKTAFAILLASTALSGVPATAGVPVVDNTAIARLGEQVNSLKQQVTELTQIRNLVNEQLQAFGSFGSLGDLFGGAGGSIGMGSEADFYENLEKFAFDPCAINLCTVGDNPVGTTDIEEARDWVMRNYYTSSVLDENAQSDLEEVRRRGVVYATTGGLALATIMHNELAGAGERADALENIVESSTDLRGDIRANSAITLAAYEVQVKQLAMLTSMLEVVSAKAMQETNTVHEDGGTSFPDAFIESDFSDRDARTRVKVTPPTKGSAGGSGMGGSLMGSLLGGGSGTDLVSDVLSDAGLGDVASILTSADPVGALTDSIADSILPTIDIDSFGLETILSDATGLASTIAEATGSIKGALNGLAAVQDGLTEGGISGNTQSLLGISQGLAKTAGNDTLATALDTGLSVLETGNPDDIIDYAEGVMEDIARNGADPSYTSYIQDQIDSFSAGELSADLLVLDASAMLSAISADANPDAALVLQADPASMSTKDTQVLLVDLIRAMADATGSDELHTIADGVENVDDADVALLRTELAAITPTDPDTDADTDTVDRIFE